MRRLMGREVRSRQGAKRRDCEYYNYGSNESVLVALVLISTPLPQLRNSNSLTLIFLRLTALVAGYKMGRFVKLLVRLQHFHFLPLVLIVGRVNLHAIR